MQQGDNYLHLGKMCFDSILIHYSSIKERKKKEVIVRLHISDTTWLS